MTLIKRSTLTYDICFSIREYHRLASDHYSSADGYAAKGLCWYQLYSISRWWRCEEVFVHVQRPRVRYRHLRQGEFVCSWSCCMCKETDLAVCGICLTIQVRDGLERRVSIQDGSPGGKRVIIVDDLVQTGDTKNLLCFYVSYEIWILLLFLFHVFRWNLVRVWGSSEGRGCHQCLCLCGAWRISR